MVPERGLRYDAQLPFQRFQVGGATDFRSVGQPKNKIAEPQAFLEEPVDILVQGV